MIDKKEAVSVIVPAAGSASRMQGVRKTFLSLRGIPVLIRSLQAFDGLTCVGELIVVVRAQEVEEAEALLGQYSFQKKITVIAGGSTRQESVQKGFTVSDSRFPYVAIHDGARPLVRPEDVERVCMQAAATGAAALGVPVKDTVKQVENGIITATPPREKLIAIQTPQVFERALYSRALEAASQAGQTYTDDCRLVEAIGHPVSVVLGSDTNIKVTTPSDIPAAEALLGKEETRMEMRIGHGYDVHRLTAGRRLILGGVEIPCEKGLDGHSDADVLVHAIMDAILGALALGDIGKHFPDKNPAYRGADSIALLEQVIRLMREQGYRLGNIDSTLLAQAPKLAPYILQMRERIAAACGTEASAVSVKATTEEGLGFTGSGDGIAAHAVCILVK